MAMTDQTSRRNSDLATALDEARNQYIAARPKSAQVHEEARKFVPGGSTRSILFYKPFPTAMASGDGCYLVDVDGRRYLDFCGEYTASLFGHSEPRIQEALRNQLARGINLSAVGEQEGVLAKLLCERYPAVDRIRFTNSGTEANMMALGAARGFTGRNGVLAFRNGYHGSLFTFLTESNVINAPVPVTLVDYNDLNAAAKVLREKKETIGAVIVEPMLGAGGCIPASKGFLEGLRQVTKETGALLIFDEVMTSRHSGGGLQALYKINPDLTTFGKYMAGGMTFGAFGGSAIVMDMFDQHRKNPLFHSGTFNNNVMSMSAGVVAMSKIFTTAAADAFYKLGENLRKKLNEVCGRHNVTMQFTGIGSMMQPHFRRGDITRAQPVSEHEEALRELFFFDIMAAGIYMSRRTMIALSLPMTERDCDTFVDATEEFCKARGPLLRH